VGAALLASACAGAPGDDVADQPPQAAFSPCVSPDVFAVRPSVVALEQQVNIVDRLLLSGSGPADIECIYAPGAVISLRGEELDLANFWSGLLESGVLVASPPVIKVVLLSESSTSADYAVIYAAEGMVPPILTVDELDGIWLITYLRSDVPCIELPERVLRELRESTCA